MILYRIVMTLFLYIRLLLIMMIILRIMTLCLKHRVIRVMKIIKRVKNPFDCF